MNEIYAKSTKLKNGERIYSETLLSHLNNTLRYANEFIERYKIDDENLKHAIKIAAAFHDIGKADYRFQQYLINRNMKNKKIFHPLLGLGFVEKITDIIFEKKECNNANFITNLKNLIKLAVASHHTPLYHGLYDGISKQDENQLLIVDDKNQIQNIVNKLTDQIGFSIDVTDCYKKNCIVTFNCAKFGITRNSNEEGIKLREWFIIIQGILNYSDWLASTLDQMENANFFHTKLNLKKDFLINPYYYQNKAKSLKENVFITLPTGSGKTETALCWILNNFVSGFRIFYTLPTTTTINSMYERFTKEEKRYGFDNNTVSRYFSNVDLYLSLEGENPRNSNFFLYKNFFYPFNITTPDQLILALMNHNRYTLKSFLMRNSLIIFDEIHAYDNETFALIKGLIKHLHEYYNTKFCIMSATFPKVLKKELSFLNASELINKKKLESEYSKRRRTRLKFFEKYVIENLSDIINLYKKGKKILVVLNIVSRAQKIFLELCDLMRKENLPLSDLVLFHSRFTFADRKKIEGKLEDNNNLPKILVSTQTIEVSLDIDYDVMFTEVCYPDSLVQRCGRVNRRGKLGNKGEGIVNIFLPNNWKENEESASLPYDHRMLKDSISIVKKYTNKISSELDYIKLTNEFYDKSWEKDVESEKRFGEIWRKVSYIYRVDLSDEEMVKLLRTRSGMITVSGYSRTHWPIIENLDKSINETNDLNKKYELHQTIRMYSINIPVMKSIKFLNKEGITGTKYQVTDANYDSLLGLKINL